MTALPTMGRLTSAYLAVALVALLGGVLTGLAQALEHAGINIYPALAPAVRSYYHGLTLHGVLNVLVWTTFFICGFLPYIAVEALGIVPAARRLGWPVNQKSTRASSASVPSIQPSDHGISMNSISAARPVEASVHMANVASAMKAGSGVRVPGFARRQARQVSASCSVTSHVPTTTRVSPT